MACAKRRWKRFLDGPWRRRFYQHGIAVNVVSPGLVATPGVAVHGLINERSKDRVQPIEFIAESRPISSPPAIRNR